MFNVFSDGWYQKAVGLARAMDAAGKNPQPLTQEDALLLARALVHIEDQWQRLHWVSSEEIEACRKRSCCGPTLWGFGGLF
jgi:hypothetical protein